MDTMTNQNDITTYYQKLITLGLPIIIQHIISTSLNLVDTIMISQRGTIAIAAVSIANKFLFIMIVTLFGLLSGKSIFYSQYFGVKDIKSIHKLLSLSIILSAIFAGLFSIIAFFFPTTIIRIFINDPEVITSGTVYLKIVSISYIPMAISFALSTASRNVHKTMTPMFASTTGLVINTALNYLLINGHYGFPALGVKGAAIATLISRLCELLLLLLMIYITPNNPIKIKLREYFMFDMHMFKKTIPRVTPVVLNEAFWSVGTSLYFIAFGKLGAESVAAVQVANNVVDFSWAIFFGIGGASAMQIGNAIGKGDNELSYAMSKRTIALGVTIAIFVGILYVIISPFILRLFNLEGATADLTKHCIWVMALYLPIRQFNYMSVVAVFRSGGDTTFSMLLDLISIWLMGLPLTHLSVNYTAFAIPVILGISYFEEFAKSFVVFKRFISKKWINNVIEEN